MIWTYKTPGIPDELFIRGKVPMTKEEVRGVTISKLRLKEDSTVVDVGAGTGSIAIEAAYICTKGKVIAIERNPEAIELISENMKHFEVEIDVVKGNAAICLEQIESFDRIIIGGSGGELSKIIEISHQKLPIGGICVINCIAIETLHEAIGALKHIGFEKLDVVSVSIARGKAVGKYTMMEGLNPIYIVSATKSENDNLGGK